MPDPQPDDSRAADPLQLQIAALTAALAQAETKISETDRLLAQANTQLTRMSSRRDVFRELATAQESELVILRAECAALRAQLEARDDQVLQLDREMDAAVAQVQRLSRAKEAFALALQERERIDAERLQFAREEINRLREKTASEADRIKPRDTSTLADSGVEIALMQRSWAEEIPADRPAA